MRQAMGPNRSVFSYVGRGLSALGAVAVLGTGLFAAHSALAVRSSQDGAAPVTFTLYRGNDDDGRISFSSWGSGVAEQTTDNALLGDYAIKVTTHGLYQGGRIDFKQPLDFGPAFANPNAYMRLMVRFNSSSGSTGGNSFPGFGGAGGIGEGGFGGSTGSLANKPPFERMRFLLVMADGRKLELIRPLDMKPSDDPDAYMPITFPLSAVAKAAGGGLAGSAATVKSLVICGDKYQQFQIGEIQVITDDTEISVAPLEEMDVFVNNDVPFQGDAEAGASTLRFAWDWDARDGIQEDAIGRSITKVFTKPGKTVVTLVVSDVDGIKKPQSVKLEIDVAP